MTLDELIASLTDKKFRGRIEVHFDGRGPSRVNVVTGQMFTLDRATREAFDRQPARIFKPIGSDWMK